MPFYFLNARDLSLEKVHFNNIHLLSYKPDQKGKFKKKQRQFT